MAHVTSAKQVKTKSKLLTFASALVDLFGRLWAAGPPPLQYATSHLLSPFKAVPAKA